MTVEVRLLGENRTARRWTGGITHDRRGRSASAISEGRSTTDNDVADLPVLIEHVDVGPALVVGNSFGARPA